MKEHSDSTLVLLVLLLALVLVVAVELGAGTFRTVRTSASDCARAANNINTETVVARAPMMFAYL